MRPSSAAAALLMSSKDEESFYQVILEMADAAAMWGAHKQRKEEDYEKVPFPTPNLKL